MTSRGFQLQKATTNELKPMPGSAMPANVSDGEGTRVSLVDAGPASSLSTCEYCIVGQCYPRASGVTGPCVDYSSLHHVTVGGSLLALAAAALIA
mmetsp:Transcript_112270/g.317332  ORF Transcript_112270/g.317332 Transcript_112270/m.317332 type:complete len:95 (+) Transcript_112270:173-457(+)